jgi:hypothetical protein
MDCRTMSNRQFTHLPLTKTSKSCAAASKRVAPWTVNWIQGTPCRRAIKPSSAIGHWQFSLQKIPEKAGAFGEPTGNSDTYYCVKRTFVSNFSMPTLQVVSPITTSNACDGSATYRLRAKDDLRGVAGLLCGKFLTLFCLFGAEHRFCDKKIDRFSSGQLCRTGSSGALWTRAIYVHFQNREPRRNNVDPIGTARI